MHEDFVLHEYFLISLFFEVFGLVFVDFDGVEIGLVAIDGPHMFEILFMAFHGDLNLF